MDLWQDAAISAFAPWKSLNAALPLFFFGVALSQIGVLKQHGVFLKKSLGQHILIDANIADKIVGALDLKPDEGVLRSGPGLARSPSGLRTGLGGWWPLRSTPGSPG